MKLSVVIPVRNGGNDLRICLDALMDSTRLPDELIVVDDASTDGTAQLASQYGILVPSEDRHPIGPARCRNQGAALAQGDVLVFLDADVRVHRNTLALMVKHFTEDAEIAALFGSYDDNPPHRTVISLYKNLQHHYVHHHSPTNPASFWTGLGAIRREIFLKLGGFNESYARPCIEDIELGVRLKEAGYQVRLYTDVQAAHLKRWTVSNLLRSDILDRAVPWTRLILSTSRLPSDLNLDFRSRLSALSVGGMLFLTCLGFFLPLAWLFVPMLVGLVILLNFDLYRFFFERGGLRFAIGATGWHFLYFLYSSLTFGYIWMEYFIKRSRQKAYRMPSKNFGDSL